MYPTPNYFGTHWKVKQQMFCSDFRESGCWIFIKKYFFLIIYLKSLHLVQTLWNYETKWFKLTVWKTMIPFAWMSHSLAGWWETHTSSLLCRWENISFFFLFPKKHGWVFLKWKNKIHNWLPTLKNVPWASLNLNSEKNNGFSLLYHAIDLKIIWWCNWYCHKVFLNIIKYILFLLLCWIILLCSFKDFKLKAPHHNKLLMSPVSQLPTFITSFSVLTTREHGVIPEGDVSCNSTLCTRSHP